MKISRYIFMLLLFSLLATLALRIANKQDFGYYRNALWGDKVGYYVYLPFVFHYQNPENKIAQKTAEKVGHGFSIEQEQIHTKYPIGVAYLEAPFYAIANFLEANNLVETPHNQFDGIYISLLVCAPPFYMAIGLFLLFLSLRLLDVNGFTAALVVAFSFFGTSAYYYTIVEGLMSHSFSFALLSTFSFLWIKMLRGSSSKSIKFWLALVIVLIILVRPFNVVLIVVYSLALKQLVKSNLTFVLERVVALVPWLLPVALILVFPQLLYYKHVYGTWLTYSYGDESFNFLSPQTANMLFDSTTGLFLYVPAMVIFFLVTTIKGTLQPRKFGFFALGLWGIVYLFSAWHSWSFGCGLGIRPFVEMVPLLVIPLATLLHEKPKLLWAFIPLAAMLCVFNVEISYRWTGCYFGTEGTFSEYISIFWPELK